MYVPVQDILRGLSSQRPTCADALPTELLTGLSVCQPFFSNVFDLFFLWLRSNKPLSACVARKSFSARAASVLDGCPELSPEALFPHNSKLGNYGEFAKPSLRASLQQ